ncbi:hypothetical protein VNO77_03813 [Canavalia gladiata]|uniref:Uncharacterized protein n=1 Tax=Canavalia gladiata TaxID=3824 RepID=A0AAN9N124_CANGL
MITINLVSNIHGIVKLGQYATPCFEARSVDPGGELAACLQVSLCLIPIAKHVVTAMGRLSFIAKRCKLSPAVTHAPLKINTHSAPEFPRVMQIKKQDKGKIGLYISRGYRPGDRDTLGFFWEVQFAAKLKQIDPALGDAKHKFIFWFVTAADVSLGYEPQLVPGDGTWNYWVKPSFGFPFDLMAKQEEWSGRQSQFVLSTHRDWAIITESASLGIRSNPGQRLCELQRLKDGEPWQQVKP